MTRQTGEIKESMMHFSSFGVNLWTNWTQTFLEFMWQFSSVSVSFSWTLPKISIFRCFRLFRLQPTNENASLWKRKTSLVGLSFRQKVVCFFDTSKSGKYWTRSRVILGRFVCWVSIFFIVTRALKKLSQEVALWDMGNTPTKRGDPENGIINLAGASVVILNQAKKP